MANVNKRELATLVGEKAGVETRVASSVLDAAIEVILERVAAGDKVVLTGLASFERRTRAARTARNPATGEQIQVPEKTVAKVTPLKAFKDAALGS
ncbi:MAG: HU family DNA-binding protein [Acidimicrobiales bacterium]|jgi:DNA-binding protein HU-beta|nr:HU family DNA-binding protein [Acidimicrobiales bacterium]